MKKIHLASNLLLALGLASPALGQSYSNNEEVQIGTSDIYVAMGSSASIGMECDEQYGRYARADCSAYTSFNLLGLEAVLSSSKAEIASSNGGALMQKEIELLGKVVWTDKHNALAGTTGNWVAVKESSAYKGHAFPTFEFPLSIAIMTVNVSVGTQASQRVSFSWNTPVPMADMSGVITAVAGTVEAVADVSTSVGVSGFKLAELSGGAEAVLGLGQMEVTPVMRADTGPCLLMANVPYVASGVTLEFLFFVELNTFIGSKRWEFPIIDKTYGDKTGTVLSI